MMLAAATDHVFLDIGHTVDFTNKAFEALEHVGWEQAAAVLPTLVDQTAAAHRAEEGGRWRHPVDLAALVARTEERLPDLLAEGAAAAAVGAPFGTDRVAALAHEVLGDEPEAIVDAICAAISAGATPDQLGQAVAYAAALRIARFHVQNDFGDWDVVHHGFTHANALHQCLRRHPSPELVRGVVHAALRIYLDRFLNVPAARPPTADDRRPGRPPGVLGRAGRRRPGRGHRLRVPAGRRRPGRPGRRPGPRPAGRGRRLPLVPDRRGRRPPVPRLAAAGRRRGP